MLGMRRLLVLQGEQNPTLPHARHWMWIENVHAARNILSAGLRFSLEGLSVEAVKGNPTTMVIPGVDDSQPSQPEAQQ
jgi:hypothetical protein